MPVPPTYPWWFGLRRLVTSSASWVALIAVVGVIIMNLTGRVNGEQALEFIAWVIGMLLGKKALEDSAAKLRGHGPDVPVPSERNGKE